MPSGPCGSGRGCHPQTVVLSARETAGGGLRRVPLNVPLARVNKGQERALTGTWLGRSAPLTARTRTLPKLTAQVRFPSPAPQRRSRTEDKLRPQHRERHGATSGPPIVRDEEVSRPTSVHAVTIAAWGQRSFSLGRRPCRSSRTRCHRTRRGSSSRPVAAPRRCDLPIGLPVSVVLRRRGGR
jgi:hypothetical protein